MSLPIPSANVTETQGAGFVWLFAQIMKLIICVFIYTHLHKLMKYYDCRCRYALYIPTELVVPSPNVLKLWVFYASVFLVLWRLSLHKLTENLAQDCWLLSPLVFSAIWDPGWTWILLFSQNLRVFWVDPMVSVVEACTSKWWWDCEEFMLNFRKRTLKVSRKVLLIWWSVEYMIRLFVTCCMILCQEIVSAEGHWI